MDLNPIGRMSSSKGEPLTQRQIRMREDAHEDEGTDCNDAPVSQGTPKIARKPPELRRGHGPDSPSSLRRNQPC